MSYTILAIPTYNEVDNIIPLYKLIRKYNKSLKILFIDDNSNDGTIAKIKSIKKKLLGLIYMGRLLKHIWQWLKELNPMKKELNYIPEQFIALYNEDKLGGMIRNLDYWLKENFEKLVINK